MSSVVGGFEGGLRLDQGSFPCPVGIVRRVDSGEDEPREILARTEIQHARIYRLVELPVGVLVRDLSPSALA